MEEVDSYDYEKSWADQRDNEKLKIKTDEQAWFLVAVFLENPQCLQLFKANVFEKYPILVVTDYRSVYDWCNDPSIGRCERCLRLAKISDVLLTTFCHRRDRGFSKDIDGMCDVIAWLCYESSKFQFFETLTMRQYVQKYPTIIIEQYNPDRFASKGTVGWKIPANVGPTNSSIVTKNDKMNDLKRHLVKMGDVHLSKMASTHKQPQPSKMKENEKDDYLELIGSQLEDATHETYKKYFYMIVYLIRKKHPTLHFPSENISSSFVLARKCSVPFDKLQDWVECQLLSISNDHLKSIPTRMMNQISFVQTGWQRVSCSEDMFLLSPRIWSLCSPLSPEPQTEFEYYVYGMGNSYKSNTSQNGLYNWFDNISNWLYSDVYISTTVATNGPETECATYRINLLWHCVGHLLDELNIIPIKNLTRLIVEHLPYIDNPHL